MEIRQILVSSVLSISLVGCATTEQNYTDSAEFYFQTQLGSDVLVLEQVRRQNTGYAAEATVRSPQTSLRSYLIEFDSGGWLKKYTTEFVSGADSSKLSSMSVSWEGDSLLVTVTNDDETSERKIAASRSVLPFIDMVHWPFDIALQRAFANGREVYQQPMIVGSRVRDFEIVRIRADSMTIKHPSRGTMGVTVDDQGRLLKLDAGLTTRKLVVERKESLDMVGITEQFVQLDREGKSFGGLSGRGNFEGEVQGASIKIDYGQPVKRGREIWGVLVPYGQRWRTGANRATHFTTDKPLKMGDLEIPAGEYTLFTIPDADGGTLIINTQTGQNGRTYDEALDLGRVDMNFRDLDSSVELFTIVATDGADGAGELRLQWDMKELVVPFEVLD